MTNFAEMGKVELRAACKAAGIPYGKLNNDGMRAALVAAETSFEEVSKSIDDAFNAPVRTAPVQHPRQFYVDMAKGMDLTKLTSTGVEGHCPHCGIDHMSNGWTNYDAMCDDNPKEAGKMTNEIECLACSGEWGPVIQRAPKGADRHVGTGVSIEKHREERNGVKRPSAGGKCRAVWDALDAYLAEIKEQPTVAIARDIATDAGWNVSNATIEFYQWRKFNGLGK